MTGVTLDTGALIAMERSDKRMRTLLLAASEDRLVITVPVIVVAEWWRGRSKRRVGILATVDVEPTSELIARAAGEAMAALPGATVVDAVVMASAAQRGDVVFTSDIEDLERMRQYFPGVRVLRA